MCDMESSLSVGQKRTCSIPKTLAERFRSTGTAGSRDLPAQLLIPIVRINKQNIVVLFMALNSPYYLPNCLVRIFAFYVFQNMPSFFLSGQQGPVIKQIFESQISLILNSYWHSFNCFDYFLLRRIELLPLLNFTGVSPNMISVAFEPIAAYHRNTIY